MVHDYREIEGSDEVTIKHMLKQFSLICEAYLSNAVSEYKAVSLFS